MKNIPKQAEKNQRRKCLSCGTEYLAKNYWQKYCSTICKFYGYAKEKVDAKRNAGRNNK